MKPLKTFIKMPRKLQWMFIEAIVLSFISRISLTVVPFKRLATRIGEPQYVSGSYQLTDEQREVIKAVYDVIKVIKRRVPWNCKCFVQALTARNMLNRRNIEGTLYLGVKHNNQGEMQAHAWIRCGQWVITGAEGHEKYEAIASFAFGPRSQKYPRRLFSDHAKSAKEDS